MTEKRKAFADAYLECMNATKAARQAGYEGLEESCAQIGSRLLRDPEVKAYLDEHFKARSMGALEVLDRFTAIARMDLSEVIGQDGSLDVAAMKAHGLDRFVEEIGFDSNGNPKIKFMSAKDALALIGKAHKMFGDSNTLGAPGGGPVTMQVVFVRPDEPTLISEGAPHQIDQNAAVQALPVGETTPQSPV